jgi:hypothetical protein
MFDKGAWPAHPLDKLGGCLRPQNEIRIRKQVCLKKKSLIIIWNGFDKNKGSMISSLTSIENK